MSALGTVQSLWRYPVKSMRGEEIDEAFAGFSGVYGDRIFAFKSAASPAGFPWLTAREKNQMLLYRPRFRHPDKAARPINQIAAEGLGSGVTPIYAGPDDLMVDVQTPSGDTLAIDDVRLIDSLRDGVDPKHELTLLQCERAMTDCRPISIFSMQSAAQLGQEVGIPVDHRRFRANIYVDLQSGASFQEDEWVGRSIRIGPRVIVSVLQRDGRCAIITMDPDTARREPAVLKTVTQRHQGMAGVYGAVLVEGTIRKGDSVELLA